MTQTPKNKPMRESMPTVAAWIDGLRADFGAECIDQAIRAGLKGTGGFYASEGGVEIGRRMLEGYAVNVSKMILTKETPDAD